MGDRPGIVGNHRNMCAFVYWHEQSALQAVDWQRNRGSARIKKLIKRKLTGAAKDLGVDHFQDPIGHFKAPSWLFWIFEVLIEGMMESKNLFSES